MYGHTDGQTGFPCVLQDIVLYRVCCPKRDVVHTPQGSKPGSGGNDIQIENGMTERNSERETKGDHDRSMRV